MEEPRRPSDLGWLAPYAVVLGMVLVIVLFVTTPIYVAVAVVLLLLSPLVRWRYREVRRRGNQGEHVGDRWRNDRIFRRRGAGENGDKRA